MNAFKSVALCDGYEQEQKSRKVQYGPKIEVLLKKLFEWAATSAVHLNGFESRLPHEPEYHDQFFRTKGEANQVKAIHGSHEIAKMRH